MEKIYIDEIKYKKHLPLIDFVKYIAYRELRLSGFVLKKIYDEIGDINIHKIQCHGKPRIRSKVKGIWRYPFYYSIIGDHLYKKHWLGQCLSYKRKQGVGCFFDNYDAYYLFKKKAIEDEIPEPPYFEYYYEWRECGYVVKTGFKFGAIFRIYKPNTTPENFEHSLYLMRILEKKRYKGPEFFSVLRIAESVKKKLIIPINLPNKEKKPDFALYKGKFLGYLIIMYENDIVNIGRLLQYINFAIKRKTNLFLGVVDRDTSLTLYKIHIITLKRPYLMIERVKY